MPSIKVCLTYSVVVTVSEHATPFQGLIRNVSPYYDTLQLFVFFTT